jgi:hypothetical protein
LTGPRRSIAEFIDLDQPITVRKTIDDSEYVFTPGTLEHAQLVEALSGTCRRYERLGILGRRDRAWGNRLAHFQAQCERFTVHAIGFIGMPSEDGGREYYSVPVETHRGVLRAIGLQQLLSVVKLDAPLDAGLEVNDTLVRIMLGPGELRHAMKVTDAQGRSAWVATDDSGLVRVIQACGSGIGLSNGLGVGSPLREVRRVVPDMDIQRVSGYGTLARIARTIWLGHPDAGMTDKDRFEWMEIRSEQYPLDGGRVPDAVTRWRTMSNKLTQRRGARRERPALAPLRLCERKN